MITFGQILRDKRKKKKWSQTKLGNKIGVGYNIICRWETNLSYPTMMNLISLADVFECSLDELVGRKI